MATAVRAEMNRERRLGDGGGRGVGRAKGEGEG